MLVANPPPQQRFDQQSKLFRIVFNRFFLWWLQIQTIPEVFQKLWTTWFLQWWSVVLHFQQQHFLHQFRHRSSPQNIKNKIRARILLHLLPLPMFLMPPSFWWTSWIWFSNNQENIPTIISTEIDLADLCRPLKSSRTNLRKELIAGVMITTRKEMGTTLIFLSTLRWILRKRESSRTVRAYNSRTSNSKTLHPWRRRHGQIYPNTADSTGAPATTPTIVFSRKQSKSR